MIVDSSALLAIILGEPDAEPILDAMSSASDLAISAATLVEVMIVAEARQGPDAADDLQALLADLLVDVVTVDEQQSLIAVEAWRRFGRGRHPAGLNLADTFAYALAIVRGDVLMFKGDDFGQTDVLSATRRKG